MAGAGCVGGIQGRVLWDCAAHPMPGPQCHPGPPGCYQDLCPDVPLEFWVLRLGTPWAGLTILPGWDQGLGTELCTLCVLPLSQPSLAPLPRAWVLRPGQLSGCPCSGQENPIPALPLVQGSASCPACHWQQLWHLRACPISPGPVAMCREQVLPCLGPAVPWETVLGCEWSCMGWVGLFLRWCSRIQRQREVEPEHLGTWALGSASPAASCPPVCPPVWWPVNSGFSCLHLIALIICSDNSI